MFRQVIPTLTLFTWLCYAAPVRSEEFPIYDYINGPVVQTCEKVYAAQRRILELDRELEAGESTLFQCDRSNPRCPERDAIVDDLAITRGEKLLNEARLSLFRSRYDVSHVDLTTDEVIFWGKNEIPNGIFEPSSVFLYLPVSDGWREISLNPHFDKWDTYSDGTVSYEHREVDGIFRSSIFGICELLSNSNGVALRVVVNGLETELGGTNFRNVSLRLDVGSQRPEKADRYNWLFLLRNPLEALFSFGIPSRTKVSNFTFCKDGNVDKLRTFIIDLRLSLRSSMDLGNIGKIYEKASIDFEFVKPQFGRGKRVMLLSFSDDSSSRTWQMTFSHDGLGGVKILGWKDSSTQISCL